MSTAPNLTPAATEAEAPVDYNHYWETFGRELGSTAIIIEAKRNQSRGEMMERRLMDPTVHTGDQEIDRWSPSMVAKEWYLSLGTYNRLRGATRPLMIAFVRLWEGSRSRETAPADNNVALREAVTEIASIKTEDGKTSELVRNMADNPLKGQMAILAGNSLLDWIRSTPLTERKEGHLSFSTYVEKLCDGIGSQLSRRSQLSLDNQRLLSDALKFKHEARFERLATQMQLENLTQEAYQKTFYIRLGQQLAEIDRCSSLIPNGDLYEHYFNVLMRYDTNCRRGETRYLVQAATRRQDQPHDGFARRRLPVFSVDAIVHDMKSELPDQYIQLKTGKMDGNAYAEGIKVVDRIITSDDNGQVRDEIMEGIGQLRMLVDKYRNGEPHILGGDKLVRRHLARLHSQLEIPTPANSIPA